MIKWVKSVFKRKKAIIVFPEDLNKKMQSSPRTTTARKLRMSMDFSMQREYIKTCKSEGGQRAAETNRMLISKKPPKKGSKKMSWAQFVENSRNVADSFTKAHQIRQKKRAEAVENRDNSFINKL